MVNIRPLPSVDHIYPLTSLTSDTANAPCRDRQVALEIKKSIPVQIKELKLIQKKEKAVKNTSEVLSRTRPCSHLKMLMLLFTRS